MIISERKTVRAQFFRPRQVCYVKSRIRLLADVEDKDMNIEYNASLLLASENSDHVVGRTQL